MSTALDVDTSILEQLDFTLTPPCEHPQHYANDGWHEPSEGAALFVRRLHCPECGDHPNPTIIAICMSAFVRAGFGSVMECGVCGHVDVRDAFWRYLGPINS